MRPDVKVRRWVLPWLVRTTAGPRLRWVSRQHGTVDGLPYRSSSYGSTWRDIPGPIARTMIGRP